MNRIFFVLSTLLALAIQFPAQSQTYTYTNPVISGFNPDPSVVRVGEDYYLVTSSFCYFPGLPIYHSKNLVDWELIGYGLHRSNQIDLHETKIWSGIYAPTIRYHQGKFYIITTNTKRDRNFIISADNPAGPWSDPVTVPIDGYDPSLYFEDDQALVTWTGDYKESHGILQAAVDVESGQLLSEPQLIFHDPEYYGAEGPHLYKIDDQYYLMIAHGGTAMGHRESVFRSDDAYGPFEYNPENPILRNTFYRSYTIQSAGHAELFEDHRGNWWMAFLGIRNFGGFAQQISLLGRETHLAPVKWEDGWPVMYNEGKITLEVTTDKLWQEPEQKLTIANDQFDKAELDLEWNFINNPDPDLWQLLPDKSRLLLKANQNNLDSLPQKALVMRRQKDYFFEAETKLSFEPTSENHEAGLTVFMARDYHYDVFLTRRKGERVLVARRRIDDINLEEKVVPVTDEEVIVKVAGDPWQYTFSYHDGEDFQKLATMKNWFITIHTVGEYYTGFTGMYLGLYAVGEAKEAAFDFFKYQSIPTDMKRFKIAKFWKDIK